MKMRNRKQAVLAAFGLLVAGAISLYSCVKEAGPLPKTLSKTLCDSLNVKYSTDILPIIQTQCVNPGCHDPGSAINYSGYDLTTYAALKSYADLGRIRARVIDGAVNGWMPTSGPLPGSDLQKIDCWLNAGAPNN